MQRHKRNCGYGSHVSFLAIEFLEPSSAECKFGLDGTGWYAKVHSDGLSHPIPGVGFQTVCLQNENEMYMTGAQALGRRQLS